MLLLGFAIAANAQNNNCEVCLTKQQADSTVYYVSYLENRNVYVENLNNLLEFSNAQRNEKITATDRLRQDCQNDLKRQIKAAKTERIVVFIVSSIAGGAVGWVIGKL